MEDAETRARGIVETAFNMGLTLNMNGEEAVKLVKNQIEQHLE